LSETGACALDERGQVWCWGRGFDKKPRKILGGVKKVSAGDSFACALRSDEKVVCWGSNYGGTLGQGPKKATPPSRPLRFVQQVPIRIGPVEPPPPWPRESKTPLLVPGADEIADLACGGSHACAVKKSGRAICWGARDIEKPREPDLFMPRRDDDDSPREITVIRTGERIDIPEIDDAIAVSASDRMSCVLRKGGEVSCWNFYTSRTPIAGPQGCNGIHGAIALDDHAWFAVLPSGEITRATYGACYYDKPEKDIADITQASSHCALRKDGVVICWGPNPHGELGRPPQPFYNERF
jgi:alpha-tubulin suppressor-like RCC1 family protein